ncbi:MAG: lytic transglycosylase domain-containing protein [Magnetococcales bacterium]|nr:lytic transglycosylase domain-containing protein [Magnetococcales bacterium]
MDTTPSRLPTHPGPALAGFLLLMLPHTGWGQAIYSFTDAQGVLHLTDRPNDRRYRPVNLDSRYTLRVTRSDGAVVYWNTTPPPTRSAGGTQGSRGGNPSLAGEAGRHLYGELVKAAARRTGLDTALLHSIIRAESNFDPHAVSAKGARGLMQLMPETARQYGVVNTSDPETNIDGGARFLADLLKQFNNNLPLSLAAYNAGPATVNKYGGRIPPYPETQTYVDRVLRYYREYRQVM